MNNMDIVSIKFISLWPISFRELSKAITNVLDQFVSVFEYLYPDFGQ